MRKCPRCRGKATRVLYMGMGGWFCDNDECATLFGFVGWVMQALPIPFNGWFYVDVDDRGYLVSLWRWLTGGDDDE